MAEKWQLKAVLSANAASLIKALGNAGKVAKTTRKYLLDVGKSAGALSGRLGVPAGLLGIGAGALSLAGLKTMIGTFAELTGATADTARGIGVTVQEFQRLKYLAEQSGAPVEVLTASVGRLNKNIGAAVAGKNKELAALFGRAGISMRDANGQIRSGADLLPEIAELFKRNQNAALQARMGNALYGRSWQQLAPLLNDGKAGIETLTARYHALGFAMSNDAVAAGEILGDKLDDLRMVSTGFSNTIAAKLTPTLLPLIERLTQWLVLNRELLSTKVAAYLAEIADDLSKIDWRGVIDGARSLINSLKWLVEAVGGAKNALIGLVVFMNLQTIAAMFGLVGSILRLVWWFTRLAWAAGVKAAGGLFTYTAATTAAETATIGLTARGAGLLKMLGAIAIAAAPLAAIWGVKEWAEDTSHDQERTNTLRGWSDSLAGMLPEWMGDPSKGARERYMANRASLIGADQAKVGGEINVRFENAPAGMRVEQGGKTGPVALNTDVGYRSFALGMP